MSQIAKAKSKLVLLMLRKQPESMDWVGCLFLKHYLVWSSKKNYLMRRRDIIDSGIRAFFFGFGLGVGTEFQSLRELVGGRGKALELYQRFPRGRIEDPGSAFDSTSRQYPFMCIGPVSPLSFSNMPLFLSAFTTPDDFLGANGIDITPRQ